MNLIKQIRQGNCRDSLPMFFFSTVILLLVTFLLFIFFKYYFNSDNSSDFSSTKTLVVDEPFSGQLYFNDELGEKVFSPVIIEAISKAKKSAELAVYSMDDQGIRDALYRASKRGVKVTMVLSDKRKDGHDQVLQNLPKEIKRIDAPSSEGYMHHKFLILDRGSNQEKLFFGSYNFTALQEKYDPSFLLETTRPEIVKIFGQEFDRLKNEVYGRKKLNSRQIYLMTRIKYPEGFLEIWFSPQLSRGGLRERMLGLINNSKDNLKVMIWNFTSKSMALDIADAAVRKSVRIIADDLNYSLPESAFNTLLSEKGSRSLEKLEIITDAKRNEEAIRLSGDKSLNSFLHHHLLLVDDRVAVFGSGNWSNNGFYSNDESTMISDINILVQPFIESWQKNYEHNK